MTWELHRADARAIPIPDGTVDLIVTSPPYWGLRSYRDQGEHYDGQIGSEDTPQQFVDELVGMIDSEWRRVLKPSGSLWLNLGDKYAGSGGHNSSAIGAPPERAPSRYLQTVEARPKSLLGLPWRVALALIDRGWILRAEVIWSKPNGLPESVTDRVRRSHEQWFHLTLEPRYFSAVDEIREPSTNTGPGALAQSSPGVLTKDSNDGLSHRVMRRDPEMFNPLGRLPGSVWEIPTEPLIIPDEARERLGLTDHFAAFPQEWPRRIISGWSPREVCLECCEGRAPVVDRRFDGEPNTKEAQRQLQRVATMSGGVDNVTLGRTDQVSRSVTGYACACPNTDSPTTPGVVLDPFCGTGTTVGVADILGRHGIGVDLSADYIRLAEWRITESGHFTKTEKRMWEDRQERLL